ncbi:MAG: hypothetical protein WED00_05035 [Aquisalimonadaceae bacterium]
MRPVLRGDSRLAAGNRSGRRADVRMAERGGIGIRVAVVAVDHLRRFHAMRVAAKHHRGRNRSVGREGDHEKKSGQTRQQAAHP